MVVLSRFCTVPNDVGGGRWRRSGRWRDVTIMYDVLFAGWLIYVIVTSRGRKLLLWYLVFVLSLSDEKYTYVEQQTRIISR